MDIATERTEVRRRTSSSGVGARVLLLIIMSIVLLGLSDTSQAIQAYRCQWSSHSGTEPWAVFGADIQSTCENAVVKRAEQLTRQASPEYSYEYAGTCTPTNNGNPLRCWMRRYQWGEFDRLFDGFYYARTWGECRQDELVHADEGTCICPNGEENMEGRCVCPTGKVRKNGQCVLPRQHCVGNPCDPATGNKIQVETDFTNPPGAGLVRTYSSAVNEDIGFGPGWTSSWHKRLGIQGHQLIARRTDGTEVPFEKYIGEWKPDPDSKLGLVEENNIYTLSLPSGGLESYASDGRVLAESTPAGQTTAYSYNTAGRLVAVVGPFGHRLEFDYDAEGRIITVTSPDEQLYRYNYSVQGNLERVEYPDGVGRLYHYEDIRFPNSLTGITDELGNRFAAFAYDGAGRAIRTEHAVTTNNGPQERYSLDYQVEGKTTVTDPNGERWDYTFESGLGVPYLTSRVSHSDGKGLFRQFDSNNNLIAQINEENRSTLYGYNDHNQQTSLTEAAGTAQERVTLIEYLSPVIDLPTRVQTPSILPGARKEVLTSYDNDRNAVSIVVQGFDSSGSRVFRENRYRYNHSGQLIGMDGPRSDVSDLNRFAYYDCVDAGECGQPLSSTNALGHVTTFDSYDSAGRVTQTTDPSDVVTTYEYDTRGRLSAIRQRAPGGEERATTFSYNALGQLDKLTGPDGAETSYDYDNAHYLRGVTDAAGSRSQYTYDRNGNPVKLSLFNPDGTAVSVTQVDYDLRKRVNGITNGEAVSQFTRDALGNLLAEHDANQNPPTTFSYDNLGRLSGSVDAMAGVTRFRYDKQNNLTVAAASNGAETVYEYDDLGRRLKEVSPDRGTILYTYNEAGNISSKTDARGVIASYAYDALNRLAGIDYPGEEEDVVFIYDSYRPEGVELCMNGVSRLCYVEDEAGTVSFAYDPWGNMITETRHMSGLKFVTGYEYDNADRVSSITYPNGRVLYFDRNRVGAVASMKTNVGHRTYDVSYDRTYNADGKLISQTMANGIVEHRTYDLQGNMVNQSLDSHSLNTIDYDANGNIVRINSSDRIYEYDALNRVVAEARKLPRGDGVNKFNLTVWGYDDNGNRVSRTKGLTAGGTTLCDAEENNLCDEVCTERGGCFDKGKKLRFYVYNPQTNQLASDGRKSILMDSAGNIVSDRNGRRTFEYNSAGRLSKVFRNGELRAKYLYNAYGQRVSKIRRYKDHEGNWATHSFSYIYDRAGNLISEYKNDRSIRDYLWAGSLPVQQDRMKTNDDGVAVIKTSLIITADQLNSPRLATDENRVITWRWDSNAFGEGGVHKDPDGDGKKRNVRLRFPGQVFDPESGLYYNWNRYYDTSTGRYISPDPIGLDGGLNTYAYARANPLRYFDSDGLEVRFVCRKLGGLARYTGKQHCFVYASCEEEGWSKTLSLFGADGLFPRLGYKAMNDPRDDHALRSNMFNQAVNQYQCYTEQCAYEKAVVRRYRSFPVGDIPYRLLGPNSNSFAQDLVTGTPLGGRLPSGAPGPSLAPGIDMPHPSFP